jgi:hypothetical protein
MASEVPTLPQHSKRVQAWVYAIMNPLIESLRRETDLLGTGNLSWRYYSKACEYIRPISEYIVSSQWPNYEDFLADNLNPGFKGRFEKHDRQVSEVESTAARLFDGLRQSGEFLKQVQDSLEEYGSVAEPPYRPLDSIKEELPKLIAEWLINRAEDLPPHYMTRKFWQDYKGKFEDYRRPPSFQELDTATAALQDTSKNLLSDLKNHRTFLCVTYDIPAAPIPIIVASLTADANLV